jgi:hypothetical protein
MVSCQRRGKFTWPICEVRGSCETRAPGENRGAHTETLMISLAMVMRNRPWMRKFVLRVCAQETESMAGTCFIDPRSRHSLTFIRCQVSKTVRPLCKLYTTFPVPLEMRRIIRKKIQQTNRPPAKERDDMHTYMDKQERHDITRRGELVGRQRVYSS